MDVALNMLYELNYRGRGYDGLDFRQTTMVPDTVTLNAEALVCFTCFFPVGIVGNGY